MQNLFLWRHSDTSSDPLFKKVFLHLMQFIKHSYKSARIVFLFKCFRDQYPPGAPSSVCYARKVVKDKNKQKNLIIAYAAWAIRSLTKIA